MPLITIRLRFSEISIPEHRSLPKKIVTFNVKASLSGAGGGGAGRGQGGRAVQGPAGVAGRGAAVTQRMAFTIA